MNKKLTAKERSLLAGAMRRVFARSDLRRQVIQSVYIEHVDAKHPRVKKWSRCPICKLPTPAYKMVVDHIDPVIPLDKSFEKMSLDEFIDRLWCDIKNLQPICQNCHLIKSKGENTMRRELKNKRKKKK